MPSNKYVVAGLSIVFALIFVGMKLAPEPNVQQLSTALKLPERSPKIKRPPPPYYYLTIDDPPSQFRGITNMVVVAGELINLATVTKRVAVLPPIYNTIFPDVFNVSAAKKNFKQEYNVSFFLAKEVREDLAELEFERAALPFMNRRQKLKYDHINALPKDCHLGLNFSYLYFPKIKGYPNDCKVMQLFPFTTNVLSTAYVVYSELKRKGFHNYFALHLRLEPQDVQGLGAFKGSLPSVKDVMRFLSKPVMALVKRSKSTCILICSGKLSQELQAALNSSKLHVPLVFKEQLLEDAFKNYSHFNASHILSAKNILGNTTPNWSFEIEVVKGKKQSLQVTDMAHAAIDAILMSKGKDVLLSDYSSYTAFILAMRRQHAPKSGRILKYGADFDKITEHPLTWPYARLC